jgi:hypothetical protein
MVHTALQAVPIVDRLPLKIEALAAWGRDKLLVGTAEGVLFVYQVRPVPSAIGSSGGLASSSGSSGASADTASGSAEGNAASSANAAAHGKPPFRINLVDAKKQFARRGVVQLGVCARAPLKCLVSLADQTVSVHALPSFSPIGESTGERKRRGGWVGGGEEKMPLLSGFPLVGWFSPFL